MSCEHFWGDASQIAEIRLCVSHYCWLRAMRKNLEIELKKNVLWMKNASLSQSTVADDIAFVGTLEMILFSLTWRQAKVIICKLHEKPSWINICERIVDDYQHLGVDDECKNTILNLFACRDVLLLVSCCCCCWLNGWRWDIKKRYLIDDRFWKQSPANSLQFSS